MFHGDTVEGDGMRVREMNMRFLWVPTALGGKSALAEGGLMNFDRARQEAVTTRSNTRQVSQNGLDTRGLDARGLFM